MPLFTELPRAVGFSETQGINIILYGRSLTPGSHTAADRGEERETPTVERRRIGPGLGAKPRSKPCPALSETPWGTNLPS
jgi:hypothetical protein